MKTNEAFQLLTLASARDGRTVDLEVASVWADDLRDVSLVDAVDAARAHYRETTDWLMPAHIIRGVKAARARRETEEARRRAIEFVPSPPGAPRPDNYWDIVKANTRGAS